MRFISGASGVLLAASLTLSFEAFTQSTIAQATSRADLQQLAQRLQTLHTRENRAAREWAARAGIPLRRELLNGKVLELQRLGPGGKPVFYLTYNTDAADSVGTDELWPGGSTGLALTGAGMTVGEWDGGGVLVNHSEFGGRVTQVDGATPVSNHATHVAGTLVAAGNGNYPTARGMAYAAQLDAYDWTGDGAEMATAAGNGLLLSNHSYGIAAGWIYLGGASPDGWWWIGGDGEEDPNFGYYDAQTQSWDQIAHDAPYYLIVKAAGNDHWDTGPEPGELYSIVDDEGVLIETSTAPRPADCAPAGYDCLPTASVAKNVLTIGSVDDVLGGYNPLAGPASVQISGFSSWGPTDDGRIKPDLVGNGWLLWSTYGQNPYYAAALGTSMAAPNVTGSLLLLQQHYENIHGAGQFMRAATLKALAIHTADETGPADGPDYTYGWGLLNTKAAAQLITAAEFDPDPPRIIEATRLDGNPVPAADSYLINISEADVTITATLVWTDPPGIPVTPPELDPTDLMLRNDLDLRITSGGDTFYPWALEPSTPAAAATKENNFRDNVEQVEIKSAAAGSYTIEVSHNGELLNSSQNYSLIISVKPPPPVSQGLLIDEDFSGGLPDGWFIETDNGISWTIRAPIPSDPRLVNSTGGSGNFAMVDSNFSAPPTNTSLRTPTFDLSQVDAVSLRFKSFFCAWDFESGYLEVSNDGGATWIKRWERPYSCSSPTTPTIDLSAHLAGQPSASIRFRYESIFDNEGDRWQIDDVKLEAFGGGPPPPPPPPDSDPPGQTDNPSPINGAAGIGESLVLTWAAGPLATSHVVYLGSDSNLDGSLLGSTNSNSMSAGSLAYESTYFWRVDAVNSDGSTPGITWSFSTGLAPATSIHVAGLSGISQPGSKGQWTPLAQITVGDQDGAAAAGVNVQGSWSSGSGETGCNTEVGGSCSLQGPVLRKRDNSITFNVQSLSKSGYSYAASANVVSSVVINKDDVSVPLDQQPSAVDDSYETQPGQEVTGNLMTNDDQGDGPASINTSTLPASGLLNLQANGSFAYTPNLAFEDGTDSFSYTIVDSDGDVSGSATVLITVSADPPPPPPGGSLSASARPYKQKGIQHVELTWQNFSGTNVEIRLDDTAHPESPTANDRTFVDNLGVKGGGQTYNYKVCEISGGACASASASF
ncbi:MAG: S8 family serine peptidase [Halioglobus sp.]